MNFLTVFSLIIASACGSHHHHLKHYRANTPGECDHRVHHAIKVYVGEHGGCETLELRGDHCIEILRSDCSYEFYSGDRCRGNPIEPNRGEFVGSVRVTGCSSSKDHGFRFGGRKGFRNYNSIDNQHDDKGKRRHYHKISQGTKGEEPWYWN